MKKHLCALGICALLVVGAACATEAPTADPEPDAGSTGIAPATDSGPDGTSEMRAPPACVGTECPSGFATCLSGPSGSASHKCGVDLLHDNANCGACGNECVLYLPLHMSSRCVDGACELQCYSPTTIVDPKVWRNCNEKIDDGCESDVVNDPNNCGTCGNACAADLPCVGGKCGCDPDKIPCDGRCVDPAIDDNNCGKCGFKCSEQPIPDECKPPPSRTHYGCRDGTCGNLLCNRGAADCNGDVPIERCNSDGCEVRNTGSDRENCGGCGITCKPDEECVTEEGNTYCGIPCARYGRSPCGILCIDLLNDVDSCGACGYICPLPGPNRARACEKGVCVYECVEGFADCNGDPSDGCEVNLRAHPESCGACGNTCDVRAGQPCVEGKCLMVDCNEPGAR